MNDTFSNAGVRATGLGAAVLALGLVLNPGHPAAQQGVRTEINLPAQSLRQSLVELGNQTGVNVISADALVAGRAAPEVSGSLTPEAAVQQLLSGSGLSYRFTNARTVVIQQVAQADGGGTGIVGDEELVGEDIIVEGEKVLRTLDETPSSVAVISGEAAASPANRTAQDAIQSVPNVLAPESSNLPAVRGIDGSAGLTGGAALTTGAQPRIPIIVDGVARPIAIGATPSLASNWDLRAVEVARGPQGTTTGRNALAGAVRIWTNDPVYSFEGAVRANFFTEEATFGGAFMLNMPVVENQVALRVAGNGSFGSTFVNVIDPALNADQQDEVEEERFSSLRAKVLITPEAIPELELLLTYERTDSQRLFSPGIVDNTADNSLTGFSAFMSVDDNEQSVYAAELRYEASDNLSFEVRGSFLDNTFIIPNLTPIFDYEQSTQTIAAEALARFSDIGPLSKGVFGVSFENQIEEGVNDVPDFFFFDFGLEGEITNYGIFTELEFPLTDQLTLIAGGRVEIDNRERRLTYFGAGSTVSIDEVAFIPKAGLRYEVNENITLGYGYSEGFRPGGTDFNLFDPTFFVTYGSERLRQHELYARTSWLDDRIDVNASAFFYTLEDAQVGGAVGDPTAAALGLVGNVPEAQGYGLEVDGSAEIIDGLTLSLGLGLLNTEIMDAGPFVPALQGQELPRAPNVTFSGGLLYESDFGLDLAANARYVGSTQTFAGSVATDDYLVVDFNAGFDFDLSDDQSIRFDAFIQNALDESYVIETFGAGSIVGRPRTFGAAATINF